MTGRQWKCKMNECSAEVHLSFPRLSAHLLSLSYDTMKSITNALKGS